MSSSTSQENGGAIVRIAELGHALATLAKKIVNAPSHIHSAHAPSQRLFMHTHIDHSTRVLKKLSRAACAEQGQSHLHTTTACSEVESSF